MPCAPQSWSVPAEAARVGAVRRGVAELAAACGLDADRVGDVRIAVSEALSNAVLHAYAADAAGSVDIVACPTDHGLCVVVRDHGTGMRPRVDSPGAGLGLGIIAAVCDRVRTRDLADGGLELQMGFATAG